jgi:hypothetical protein
MSMRFWDLGRTPGPDRRTERWALVSGILLALVAAYAIVTSSNWAWGLLLVAGLVLFVLLMGPGMQKALEHEQTHSRMHQTLDVPFDALPRRYRWLLVALVVAVFLAGEWLRR